MQKSQKTIPWLRAASGILNIDFFQYIFYPAFFADSPVIIKLLPSIFS